MRLHFLDNLRFALTILVILHHTAVAYGGGGEWPYRSKHHAEISVPLLAFTAINQSFFMGSFFFISGILSHKALARKQPTSFIKDKLNRLALPAIIYTLIATPVQDAMLELLRDHHVPSTDVWLRHWDHLRAELGVKGPVWFLVILCIFDCTYAIGSILSGPALSDSTDVVTDNRLRTFLKSMHTSHCMAGILLCGFVSFLVRLQRPTSHVYRLLNIRLGYVPQYILLFGFGLIVDPTSIVLLPRNAGRAIAATIVSLVVLTFHVNYQAGASKDALEEFSGGLNSKAATYALMNELVGYLLFANSFQLFRSHCSKSWEPITDLSYAMFLVHAPVSVVVETLTDSWLAGAVTKTIIIGALNCCCSIGTAWLLKQVPGVGRAV